MIHFDFAVEDRDAELIFECINFTINDCIKRKLLSDITQAESDWCDKHIEYLSSLKKKMFNKSITTLNGGKLMEEVTMIASGYEWECPKCEVENIHPWIPVIGPALGELKCMGCGEVFSCGGADHCYNV